MTGSAVISRYEYSIEIYLLTVDQGKIYQPNTYDDAEKLRNPTHGTYHRRVDVKVKTHTGTPPKGTMIIRKYASVMCIVALYMTAN